MGIKDKLGEWAGQLKDHLAHRLSPETIAQEFVTHMEQKVQPQGADELANVLYHGSAYLPWPGPGLENIREAEEIGPPAPAPEIDRGEGMDR